MEDQVATGDETEPSSSSGPPGSEPPLLPRKPSVHHGVGVKRRRSSPKKPLSNKPQDFQVRRGAALLEPTSPRLPQPVTMVGKGFITPEVPIAG